MELTCNHLTGERGVTAKIKQAMQEAAKQFVYIGFLLWEVKQYEYYYEIGYDNVYQYAEYELGLKRSSTKNFIAICETFCRKDPSYSNIPTMFLDERWSDYQYSQLTEMLSMSPAQRQETKPDMTVRQLREAKKAPAIINAAEPETNTPIGQTSGQENKSTSTRIKPIVYNHGRVVEMSEETIREICKVTKLPYNPNMALNITAFYG